MTYRERREARAERLRGWADRRTKNAEATLAADDALPYADDIAFLTQPGRIVERERMNRREHAAYRSLEKAEEMRRKADHIAHAADHAIYSDDPDAAERLGERIADLEEQRARIASYNADCRRMARIGRMGDLSILSPAQQRAALVMAQAGQLRAGGALPGYAASNLSGNIARLRARLARIEEA
jgi:hypothetical protein